MKRDDDNIKSLPDDASRVDAELELMLKAVEKAGRDSRRREALSAMLDQMAAAEAAAHRKAARRRWSIGISAAACLLLFVTTIVWLTNIGDGVAAGPLTAEVDEKNIVNGDTVADTVAYDNNIQNSVLSIKPSKAIAPTVTESAPMMAETKASQEETTPMPSLEEKAVDTVSLGDEVLFDAGQFAEADLPGSEDNEDVKPSPASPRPAQVAANTTAAKSDKRRSRWVRHHRDDRSKMDGTMLAFNIL
ncbi:MAG: hypothetical protein IKJ40_00495 [Bacteroidales bacterium]|nr:hypothetical protein [Bacteroidales bacterium]